MRKRRSKNRLLVIILIIAIAALGTLLALRIFNSEETEIIQNPGVVPEPEEEPEPEPEINIFSGNSRPVAFIIDNAGPSSWPHVRVRGCLCCIRDDS